MSKTTGRIKLPTGTMTPQQRATSEDQGDATTTVKEQKEELHGNLRKRREAKTS